MWCGEPGFVTSADGERITLRMAGMSDFEAAVDLAAERRPVTMFGSSYRGIDQGAEVAGWLRPTRSAKSSKRVVP